MDDDAPITQLLNEYKAGKRDSAGVIVAYFWEFARRNAHNHLSARVRRVVRGSDVANPALLKALRCLEKPEAFVERRSQFAKLILEIIEAQCRDVGRWATAKVRDVRKERPLPGWDALPQEMEEPDGPAKGKGKRSMPPSRFWEDAADRLAIAREMGEFAEKILMQESDDETRAIVQMGFISRLTPREIQKELKSSGAKAPSIRRIQRDLQRAEERLKAALRENYEISLPPKKGAKKKKKVSDSTKKTASKKAAGRRTKGRKRSIG